MRILKRPTEVHEDTKQALLNADLVTDSGSTATTSENSDKISQKSRAQIVEGTVDPVDIFNDNNDRTPLPIDDALSSRTLKEVVEDRESKGTTTPHELMIQGEVNSRPQSNNSENGKGQEFNAKEQHQTISTFNKFQQLDELGEDIRETLSEMYEDDNMDRCIGYQSENGNKITQATGKRKYNKRRILPSDRRTRAMNKQTHSNPLC